MSYSIDRVPTFLLHDGISWCRKNNRARVRFFRVINDRREDIIATPKEILDEIVRRIGEPASAICEGCGAFTDGRCCFVIDQPLCEPCYWNTLVNMHSGTPLILTPQKPTNTSPRKADVIILPVTPEPIQGPQEETPEQIAERLGVPLEVLQANGYFD